MSSFSKRTSISPFNLNIITWTLDKQCESQSDSNNNNINIIKIFISDSSNHCMEIPVTYPELCVLMITKDCSHWQSLLKFSWKQLKNDLIQFKFDTIINQIDNHLAADFYELMAAWQQIRIWDNIWVVQLITNLKKTQQHWDEYQKAYQTIQTELQELQTQLNIMNENHQITLQQIQNQNIWI